MAHTSGNYRGNYREYSHGNYRANGHGTWLGPRTQAFVAQAENRLYPSLFQSSEFVRCRSWNRAPARDGQLTVGKTTTSFIEVPMANTTPSGASQIGHPTRYPAPKLTDFEARSSDSSSTQDPLKLHKRDRAFLLPRAGRAQRPPSTPDNIAEDGQQRASHEMAP